MRFYALSILNAQTGLPIRNADGSAFGPWTTLLPPSNPALPFSGPVNPGALRIKFDIPVISADIPAGAAQISIWGVGLPSIYQTAKFNPAFSGVLAGGQSYCSFTLQAGMSPGLPLATAAFNARQTGLILSGSIQQAYGNWEGTDQRLDFIVQVAPKGINNLGTLRNPRKIGFQWLPGQPLGVAVANTLTAAFPGTTVTGANELNPVLVLPTPSAPQHGNYSTLEEFAQLVNSYSQSIVAGSTNAPAYYSGVKILVTASGFDLRDGSQGLDLTIKRSATQLAFTDLVGQPTWLSPVTLAFKTVLRSDIRFGSYVTMPQFKTSSGQNVPIPTATTASSWAQYRDKAAFTGTFLITGVRHLGDSRQPTGDSWVTQFEANALTPQPMADAA